MRPAIHPGSGAQLTFEVPADTCSNRRYSTLKLLHRGIDDSFDAAVEHRFAGVQANRFNAPRDAPVFVNIRYEVNGPVTRHLDGSSNAADFAGKIARGGYQAAMFEDSICDGCVVARLEDAAAPAGDGAARSQLERLRKLEQLPAFSIVTAPDFFPEFAPIDLDAARQSVTATHFYSGGTSPLSFTRLRANPALRFPGTQTRAFPTSFRDWHFQDTVTAVVSGGRACAPPPAEGAPSPRAGFLPDGASAVFFPGWDVTYVSRGPDDPDVKNEATFLGTYGLGSPFPEDMKLCAATNGMWPASSPDGARTFQGSLQRPRSSVLGCQGIPFTRFGGTAVPLLDDELGFHPRCPAARARVVDPRRGWDGEYGPFLERTSSGKLAVDYAQIDRVDYVENALLDRIDASVLRGVTLEECLSRMECLRRCLRHIDGEAPSDTDLWLVSAERISEWTASKDRGGPRGLGLLDEMPRDVLLAAQPGVSGQGYLFVFVEYEVEDGNNAILGTGADWVRSRMICDKVHVCQVSVGRCVGDARRQGVVAATIWDPAAPQKRCRWTGVPAAPE